MAILSKFVLIPLVAAVAAGCSGARGGASPEPDTRVAIEVRNLSGAPIQVQLCTTPGCLPIRIVEGRRQTVFMFQPQSDRATVYARAGDVRRRGVRPRPGSDRILEHRVVQFQPGERHEVVFNTF